MLEWTKNLTLKRTTNLYSISSEDSIMELDTLKTNKNYESESNKELNKLWADEAKRRLDSFFKDESKTISEEERYF